MPFVNCNCRCNCTASAFILSVILGVLAAFLQITGIISVAPVFLWVAFGIAVVYLGVLIVATALANPSEQCSCMCFAVRALLFGILGTILFALILLAVGVETAGAVVALLLGLLVFFFALMLTNAACFVRSLSDCGN